MLGHFLTQYVTIVTWGSSAGSSPPSAFISQHFLLVPLSPTVTVGHASLLAGQAGR